MKSNSSGAASSVESFLSVEVGSGIVLLAAAMLALAWVNSPWGASYVHAWELPLTPAVGRFASRSLHFWINDGLMAVFFLVVGLEIRRELDSGTLGTLRLAALPLAAALGGVVMPALLYLAVNWSSGMRSGWAVPTATDIAFAVGVLALLGRRVTPALRVLLLAIAIIDDVVAVLVIAAFYSGELTYAGVPALAVGAGGLTALRLMKCEQLLAYIVPGALLWVGLLYTGIHPALAGVLLGLAIPAATGSRLEQALHPWVAFGIMPIFALANAGVKLDALMPAESSGVSLTTGVIAGLVVGKPVGILLASRLSIALGWCALPAGIGGRQILIIGCLAGIGFTMAIFICDLAFVGDALATAKLAVLTASFLAAVIGLVIGRCLLPLPKAGDAR